MVLIFWLMLLSGKGAGQGGEPARVGRLNVQKPQGGQLLSVSPYRTARCAVCSADSPEAGVQCLEVFVNFWPEGRLRSARQLCLTQENLTQVSFLLSRTVVGQSDRSSWQCGEGPPLDCSATSRLLFFPCPFINLQASAT